MTMQEMTANSWKRRGCSIVWSPVLRAALITDTEAAPLRTALSWQRHGLPESPPGGGKTILVGGLQTVLELTPDADTAYAWLRANILPLCRMWSNHWAGVGLVFGMDGPSKAPRWDLIVFDEAHHLTDYQNGAKMTKTQT